MILAIAIDWFLINDVFFIASILTLSKFGSFENEAHIFLYQKGIGIF